jgi:hypothetical protein
MRYDVQDILCWTASDRGAADAATSAQDAAGEELEGGEGDDAAAFSAYRQWELPAREFDGLWERYDAHISFDVHDER